MTRRKKKVERSGVMMRVTQRGLVPVSAWDAEQIDRYPMGSVVEVELHLPQSSKQARKLRWIVGLVASNTDEYANGDALMTALKYRLKHVRSVTLMGGGMNLEARSLDDFDGPGLNQFFEQCMEVISTEVIPGLDTKKLAREASNRVGNFDASEEQ